jgi:tetratricopeptide (TPR) repeat protein
MIDLNRFKSIILIIFIALVVVIVNRIRIQHKKKIYLKQESIDIARMDIADSLICDEQNFDAALLILDSILLNVPDNYPEIIKRQKRFWYYNEYVEYIEKTGMDIPCIGDVYSKVFYNYAIINIERKNWDKANEFLLRGLKQIPNEPHLLCEMGMLYETKFDESLDENDLYEAINYFKQGFELGASLLKARALRGIGFCCIELGDLENAEECYKNSLDIVDNENARNELGYINQLKNGGVKAQRSTILKR